MLSEAFALAESALATGRPFIWLAADGWHKGLIGLIAGRVAERYGTLGELRAELSEGRHRRRHLTMREWLELQAP